MYWTYKYWIDKYNKKLSKAYIRMRLIFKCGLYSNWLIFKCGFYFDCTYFLLKSRQKSNVVIFATFEMMFHSFKIEATSRRLKNIVFFGAFCKLSIYSKLIWDTYRLKLSILFLLKGCKTDLFALKLKDGFVNTSRLHSTILRLYWWLIRPEL